MKKVKYLLLLISFFIVVQSNAQPNKETIKAKKIAFLTDQLQLSVKEAQTFWPIYNEFESKKKEISEKKKTILKDFIVNEASINETKAATLADQYVAAEIQEAKLIEEYNTKFKKVLPAKKVIKLYQAELQFKNNLIKDVRQ